MAEQYSLDKMYCSGHGKWIPKSKAVGKGKNRCPDCNALMRVTRRNGLARILRLRNQPDPRYIRAID
jgi:ribosomal protein S14